jgi:hypothetical protein
MGAFRRGVPYSSFLQRSKVNVDRALVLPASQASLPHFMPPDAIVSLGL